MAEVETPDLTLDMHKQIVGVDAGVRYLAVANSQLCRE